MRPAKIGRARPPATTPSPNRISVAIICGDERPSPTAAGGQSMVPGGTGRGKRSPDNADLIFVVVAGSLGLGPVKG